MQCLVNPAELFGERGCGLLWRPAQSMEPLSSNSPSARAVFWSILFLCILKINFTLKKRVIHLFLFFKMKSTGLLHTSKFPVRNCFEVSFPRISVILLSNGLFLHLSDTVLLVTDSIILVALHLGSPDPNLQFSLAKILCSPQDSSYFFYPCFLVICYNIVIIIILSLSLSLF